MIRIVRADHLVLTVRDIPATVRWYSAVLGMRPVTFGDGRRALTFGGQKLNLHQAGRELEPRAARPVPGSADLCLVSAVSLDDVQEHLRALAVPVELGPVARTGATGPITSVYLRDPDENLVEISTYDSGRPQAPDPYDLLPPVAPLTVHSPDIADGRPLAESHVHDSLGGGNKSPELTWAGAPEGTCGYAVTCFDPDAPTGSGFWHWILTGLPGTCTRLPGNAGRGDGGHLPAGALHLRNDFGAHAYGGAAPPAADPAHRYVFAVHAVDTDNLGLTADTSAGRAGLILTALTIARGVLRPTCQRGAPSTGNPAVEAR
ncbi:YbhB/YbcL family Raf kinase inhibitor-like protein [Actinomadura verrucosospora]|uniref:YbhB/YbcL family Raf kinase inhibitor-like protein n=1 Tax=Actinomadura verrucosospora TaxID=46165 RepID=UPI001C20B6EE|nr:YbhB/YbcL family Raf kinase inhibitor-like protein [Actinomadura verrucosospora]